MLLSGMFTRSNCAIGNARAIIAREQERGDEIFERCAATGRCARKADYSAERHCKQMFNPERCSRASGTKSGPLIISKSSRADPC
jgi:hypothetical protein